MLLELNSLDQWLVTNQLVLLTYSRASLEYCGRFFDEPKPQMYYLSSSNKALIPQGLLCAN